MVAGIFAAKATPTTVPFSVRQFYAAPPTSPGNVGVTRKRLEKRLAKSSAWVTE